MSWFRMLSMLLLSFILSSLALSDESGNKSNGTSRTDLYGDPLPPGAVARMGTIRLRHENQGTMATAFSPDGQIFASGVQDTIRLWDTSTGNLLLQIKSNYEDGPLLFSPDSKWLATSFEESVVLLDAANGQLVKRIPAQSMTFAFSPNGETLAIGSKDGSIFLWNTTSAQQISHLTGESKRPALHIGFSKDGKSVVSLTRDNKLSRWDVTSGKFEKTISLGLPEWREAVLSPDLKTLAVMPAAKQPIQLWDVDKAEKRLELQGDKATSRQSLAFSWDSKTVAAIWIDPKEFTRSACLWDAETGKARVTFPITGGTCSFSPDGKSLLTNGSALRFWDSSTGRPMHEFPNHEGAIRYIAFTPDGKSIVSAGGDIRVWEAATGKFLRQLLGRRVTGLEVLPDGHQVLSAELEGMLRLQNIDSAHEVRHFVVDKKVVPGPKDGPVAWGLGLSPDGKTAFSFSREGGPEPAVLHTWDMTSGKSLFSLPVRDATNVRLFSPDARLFVRFERLQAPNKPRGRFDFQDESRIDVVLQDVMTDKPVLMLPQPDQLMFNPTFSADSQILATATAKPVQQGPSEREGPVTLHLWELFSGKEMQRITMSSDVPSHLQALAYAPDQRVIATVASGWKKSGGQEQWIQLWDSASGKELMSRSGFDSNTRGLAFSPDGKLLVSGHEEGYLLAWDVSSVSPFKSGESKNATSEELESWWSDLAGEDARKAGAAIWKFVDAGSQAVDLLRDRLKPAPGPPMDKMKQWIEDLDSNDFQRREEATRQLAASEELAQPALREFLKGKPSAEQRRRIEGLLEPSLLVKSPDKRQKLRAVQVLERIGSPEARAVLTNLSKGAPDARLTIAAKAAGDRLDRKAPVMAKQRVPKKLD